MVVAEVTGRFKDFAFTLEQVEDDFAGSKLTATVKTASIDTENDRRDSHLRSDDFFGAERYPEITFVSTAFEKTGENRYRVPGDLTIRDVTKPVVLDLIYNGSVRDSRGNTKAGFKASVTIDRFDFGVSWDKTLETGELVAGREVAITILVEVMKESES
jgi:polyisoprenoid-binding protein YceI